MHVIVALFRIYLQQVNSISVIYHIRWTASGEQYFTYFPHQVNSIRWTVFHLYYTSGEQHQVNSISAIFHIRWTASGEQYFIYIQHQVNSIRWIVFHLYSTSGEQHQVNSISWQKAAKKLREEAKKKEAYRQFSQEDQLLQYRYVDRKWHCDRHMGRTFW